MAHPAAGATYAHAHGNRDGDAFADFAHIPYPATNGDRNMDNKPESDRETVVYRDPDSNLIVYSHGYLHFATENYCDLDLDSDDNTDRNADLHQGATVPVGDELERKGAKV